MSAPSREKVLRSLFWTLLFRGRTVQQANEPRRRKQIGLGITLALYAVFGFAPGLSALWFPPFVFASSLHVMTMLFASLSLAASMGTMLFVREEAEILLHRPVRAEEVLRAKCAVLVAFSLLSALALNAVGLVTSFWNRGNAWWFVFAHALTTVLLMLFSTAAVVVVYNVCLRWFGRERFENLLTTVQVLLSIVMIAAMQFVPRVLDSAAVQGLVPTSAWALALPPLWFAALDMILCDAVPFATAWLPAAIGVGVTVLLAWLAFVKLGSSYGTGLMRLAETASSENDRPRRRLIGALLALPPLRWWLRDPIERQGFLLTSAYLVRDRETKLKLYPSLAPMVVIPLAIGFSPRAGATHDGDAFLAAVPLALTALQPLTSMPLLARSQQYRAAELFRIAPVPHWSPLFHGARKAALAWLCIPGMLAAVVVLALIRGTAVPFAMAVPMLAIALATSHVPGLFGEWLPFGAPMGDLREASSGCLVNGLVMAIAMGLGAVAASLYPTPMFWPFVALLVGASLALQHVFAARVRQRRWRAPRT